GISLLIILISADHIKISTLVKHIFHLNSETQLTFFRVIIFCLLDGQEAVQFYSIQA
ncbi:MAG: hypothetical protein ACJAY3_001312, partial [Neolewinella sp.]